MLRSAYEQRTSAPVVAKPPLEAATAAKPAVAPAEEADKQPA
jgi:hypothetical protein